MEELPADAMAPINLAGDVDKQQAPRRIAGHRLAGAVVGCAVVLLPTLWPPLRDLGFQPLGPLLAVALIVFSLFGDLPSWIAWTQRLGSWLFPGLAVGTVLILIPLLLPTPGRETSLVAFSPSVWAAYISIVMVSVSFEASTLPKRIYRLCKSSVLRPATFIPLYVAVAGLLGNVLDGVSIIAISVVIFLSLLPVFWAARAAFALLFGGLISNLITVAAEPTNIKFQDVLHPLLDRVTPPFWATNWPISVFGILLPTLWLAYEMRRHQVDWKHDEPDPRAIFGSEPPHMGAEMLLSLLAIILLGLGIITHAVLQGQGASSSLSASEAPLWLLLLPAGVAATLHLTTSRRIAVAGHHIRHEWTVWGKLMIIFSLLWFLANGLAPTANAFSVFFTWPLDLRYGVMVVLSLLSSITDNVALAAMQGSLIVNHPLAIWQVRLLFVLLTWSGGFTPFGCLQSLALNSRLKLTTRQWFQQTPLWAILAIIGGLLGLGLISLFYPTAVGLLQ